MSCHFWCPEVSEETTQNKSRQKYKYIFFYSPFLCKGWFYQVLWQWFCKLRQQHSTWTGEKSGAWTENRMFQAVQDDVLSRNHISAANWDINHGSTAGNAAAAAALELKLGGFFNFFISPAVTVETKRMRNKVLCLDSAAYQFLFKIYILYIYI